MVVGQVHEDESRKRLPALLVFFGDFLDELVGAVLVRDVGVEAWILPRGVAVKRRRHGHIGQDARAGWFFARLFLVAGQFKPFAEVAARDAVTLQMVPDRAALRLFFRVHGGIAFGEQQPARSRSRKTEIFSASV